MGLTRNWKVGAASMGESPHPVNAFNLPMMELGRAIIDGPPAIIDRVPQLPAMMRPGARFATGNALASPPPKPRKVEKKTDYEVLRENQNLRMMFFFMTTRASEYGASFRYDAYGYLIHADDYSGRGEFDWTIDHIKPVAHGGSDDLWNLRPLQWQVNCSRQDGRF